MPPRNGQNKRGQSSSSSRRRHPVASTIDASIFAAQQVVNKESEYRSKIKKINASALLLADRVAIEGELKDLLSSSIDVGTNNGSSANEEENENLAPASQKRRLNETNQTFLMDMRTRLKNLSMQNVKRERDIDVFIATVESIQRQIELKRDNQGGTSDSGEQQEEQGDPQPPDYETEIMDKIAIAHDTNVGNGGNVDGNDENFETDIENEQYCRDMRNRLGEKEKKRKKKKNSSSRISRGADDDDEEDLEVMNTNAGVDSEQQMKCSLTSNFFENPVKSTQCNHTYSLDALRSMIGKKRSIKCPYYGCNNTELTMDQIEEDVEMTMRVKRFFRRQEAQKDMEERLRDDELNVDDYEGRNSIMSDRKPDIVQGMTVLN